MTMNAPLGYTYYSYRHNGDKLAMDLKNVLCESSWGSEIFITKVTSESSLFFVAREFALPFATGQ